MLSEPTKRYLNERQAFNQRHGTAATQAYKLAHKFAVERGLKPDTVEYFKYCDDALELYAKDYGLRYDPSEKVPHAKTEVTAEEAEFARSVGVDLEEYRRNKAKMHQMKASGVIQK